MNFIIWFLLAVFWMVLGFFALRTVLTRVLRDRRSASIAAVLTVLAYAAGYYSPLASHGDASGAPQPSAPPQTPVAAAAAPVAAGPGAAMASASDTSAVCARTAKIGGAKTLGYVDVVRAATPRVRVLERTDGVSPSQAIEVMGWAGSASGSVPATAVCLVLDGRIDGRAQTLYGFSRPDVATNLHVPALEATGFEIRVKAHTLPPGTHRLKVLAVSDDGSSGELQNEWTLNVR